MNERIRRLADYIVGARGETVDYYKLGETTGKAWRLGHMGEPVWEAGIHAREDLHIMEGTHEAESFYRGFNAGVSAVDAEAAKVELNEPIHLEAQTLDGDNLSLFEDPESTPQFSVCLNAVGMYITWEAESREDAQALYHALQHVKVHDVD